MISKINFCTPNINNFQKNKQKCTNSVKQVNEYKATNTELKGVPVSYISFKSSSAEKQLKTTIGAEKMLKAAKEIATRYNHTEITPYHILLASIEETEEKLAYYASTGQIIEFGTEVSTLHTLVNNFAKKNVLNDSDSQELFLEELNNLKNDTLEELSKIPQTIVEDEAEGFVYSEDLKRSFANINEEVNEYNLLGIAINTLTFQGVTYASNFLGTFQTLSLYKSPDEIYESYLEAFDPKAIEMWNKLALGSNLFVLSKNNEDKDRIVTSFISTINSAKHGNYNENNTSIFAIADDVDPNVLINELEKNQSSLTDEKMIVIMDLDNLLPKLIDTKSEAGLECKPEFYKLINLANSNTKFIFLQNENENYQLMLSPAMKKIFKNYINYNIPPIQSYEVSDILRKNKQLLKEVKKPFYPDAREKAIILAEKMDGAYPDKAVELMKRISEYYGDEVKKITAKDIDEFAYIASDIFKEDSKKSSIVYNTGKTLSSYYGKETTKKDIENIVKQIKTGRIGTQGYIISAKDKEAGAGKKYTAEVIAGEAKVPFLEINTSDFATASYDDDLSAKIPPATVMTKYFNDIKLAARQNPYKTAIIYINNFDEFAFSDNYNPGYKQAVTQLSREMEKAIKEDINILVMGSTQSAYTEYIPLFIKDFSQNIVVDSPAFNKKSRKEVLINTIAKEKLPLVYKTNEQKEVLINKLVKLTEYFSYVDIKNLINKTAQIMIERNKSKAGIGEFIEAYLQLVTGRTSQPEMPLYNKKLITSHECGHATNLEVINKLYQAKGQPWYRRQDVNFITLDPRGDFLGAVFEGSSENASYPFEALFSDLVCSYGGHSCEKAFFDMDGSAGISQDLASATAVAKRGIERFGLGYHTGKISNAANIQTNTYSEKVYSDLEVFLTNAQIASDLITEAYKDFNTWFTNKYSKLIGTDNCMVDGDEFRKQLTSWIASQSEKVKEELAIVDEILLDIIKSSKNGKIYYHTKKLVK